LIPFETLSYDPEDDLKDEVLMIGSRDHSGDLNKHVHVIHFKSPDRANHQSSISQLVVKGFTIIVSDDGKDINLRSWLPFLQVSYIDESEIETESALSMDHINGSEKVWIMVEADANG
jgi:hypothetical protein